MSNTDSTITLDPNVGTDQVANVLKWILLVTAIVCFAVVIWGTFKTYQLAPPLPQQFVTTAGQVVMTENDIVAGKAGFQRADLMDYGSLYGMGSSFGEDYTAKYLVRLGRITEEEIAQQRFGKSFVNLSEGDQYVVRKNMQQSLQQLNLSGNTSTLSQPITKAVFR
jgi:nitric oxide reductase subunit B